MTPSGCLLRRAGCALILLAGGVSMVGPAEAQIDSAEELRSFLLNRTDFTESDLSAVDDGEIVAHPLELDDEREIAVMSLARFNVPARFIIPYLREAETYASGSATPDVGRISSTPRLEDLSSLTFPRSDLKDLSTCAVGACAVKLSERMIGRFQTEIDWESPEYAAQVSALTREMLLEYAKSYRSGGDEALGAYADKPEPLSIAEGFDALLEDARYVQEFFPDLHAYLSSYPGDEPAGTEDFMYWLREDFGLKPVVSLYHAVVYTPNGDDAPPAIVALKQLYASHYFQAVLNVMAVVEAGTDAEPAAYVVFTRRPRFDGPLTGFRRLLVRVRLQDGGTATLDRLREALQEEYRAGRAESGRE